MDAVLYYKITKTTTGIDLVEDLKKRGYDIIGNGNSFEFYVKCPKRRMYEIEGLKKYNPVVKYVEPVTAKERYLLYVGGATDQKHTNPYMFAFMPIALIKTYEENPTPEAVFKDVQCGKIRGDGYILLKQIVVQNNECVVLESKPVFSYFNIP